MFNFLKNTAYILVLVGALNWGSVGIFNFDLVGFLFGLITVFSVISSFCTKLAFKTPKQNWGKTFLHPNTNITFICFHLFAGKYRQ